MIQELQSGQCVTVNSYSGKQILTVVEDRKDIVLICRPEEFERARAENRLPTTIGFHREDIIGVEGTDQT